ncbi:MFS transporter [Novosphingobium umbonatum]|uniref:MFS transporter n=1 Tax=Novosphingobium umbonatum TaxID=1908524 RepID=A0A3S2V4H6_9SPHN|nr:MFS transporter [Novosphingobium umbonatum]RVU03208.1 MFS transporter [Novosphingobium umbonatum]
MPPPTNDPQSSSGLSSQKAWSILWLLALGVLIAYVDRTSISSALADRGFAASFKLDNMDRGWLNSAFFWTYGLVQMPAGYVVDRYGVKVPYTVCFVLWCGATAATGLTSAFSGLLIMRLLIGATEAIVMPASYRWIRNNFKEGQSGTAVGIFAMGNKFGPALGAPVAAWLIVQYNWQTMFLLTGAIGLVWLVPWMVMVRNDWPSAEEMVVAKRTAGSISMGAIMKSPVVWGALITNFCYGYFTFFCMTWMPSYLVEKRGLSLSKSGLYTFFSFAGIALVALVAGWVADRMIAKGKDAVLVRKLFVMAGFVGGCTVLLGAWSASLQWALFWNVFSLSCLGLATANNLALCRLTLIPKPAVGMVTGIQQVATSLAGGVSASLSGWLLDVSGGYDLPMMVIFAFLVVGAASTWILLRPEWAPKIIQV